MRMTQSINLHWSEGTTIDGSFYPEDKLDRAKYATFLTKLLASQGFDESREEGHQKHNYVLNLNAEWGAGKTYFLKRWSEDLKKHFPVVYVDAWKKDYSDDPLMTVIASIIEQLRDQAGKNKDDPQFKVPRKLIGLLKAAAPGIGRSLFKRFAGIDPVEVMNADEGQNTLGAVKDSNGEPIVDENGQPLDMSFAASEAVKYLIDEHDAKSSAIESLKQSVSEWVKAVVGIEGKKLPAFIFIDELDRCRPSYAVEMLETIKHIFDIEGVVFVVATDTEQLQHAVKAVYGLNFNANVYLSRFFNSRYSLKAPNLENFLEVHSDAGKLSGNYFRDLKLEVLPFNEDPQVTLRNISVLLNAFEVSARTAIQIADRVVATISNMPQNSKVDILMLTTLLCIKEKDTDLFDEIVSGKFERIEKKADNEKRITLDKFFESFIKDKYHTQLIETNFTPSEICYEFKLNLSSKPQPNQYPEGNYRFQLIEYLKEIFSNHFKSIKRSNFSMMLNDRSDSETESPILRINQSLVEKYREHKGSFDNLMTGQAALLWIKFIYLHKDFQSITTEEYKDFVELASPLDWMGKNELDEIN